MRRGALAWERFEHQAPKRAEPPAATETEAPRGPAPAVDLDALLARARGEGRAEGFEAGVAEAEARADTALRLVLSEIVERLEDHRVATAERREAVSLAAAEICEALLTGLAPAFARTAVATEVAAAMVEGIEARSARPARPTIRVAEAQAASIAAALAEAGAAADIAPDPQLGDLHARIEWSDGADVIDLDAAIDSARAALDRHIETTRRRTAHG